MKYFDSNSTLMEIVEKYPETIPVFTSSGFNQMDDEKQREKFAKSINLKMALMLKQIDYDTFEKLLIESIENNSVDATLSTNSNNNSEESLNVVGLLPCPVRIPLLESFNKFISDYKTTHSIEINHELKAASMGLDWVENNLKNVDDHKELPDIFISAGFDMFFDEKMIGKFKKQNIFADTTKLSKFNPEFEEINLKDPKEHYAMIGVVPAVFLINKKELGDRKMPTSWADILDPTFQKRVSLPVGDFDLFNGILLNIYKHYGDEGVKKLGRSLLESMHPSQMVKSDRKKENKPIVTIMPYFFTKMVKDNGHMAAVWPSDGAIISPIFMLSKQDKLKNLQPVIDFFSSKEVGEILSHSGLFPSVHPNVDNHIPPENKYMWLGWDYIYNNDISTLIKHCENLFESEIA